MPGSRKLVRYNRMLDDLNNCQRVCHIVERLPKEVSPIEDTEQSEESPGLTSIEYSTLDYFA